MLIITSIDAVMSRIPEIRQALAQAGDGEDLDLRFIQLSAGELDVLFQTHLAKRESITQLWLHGCNIRDIGLKRMSMSMRAAPQLTHLSLSDNGIGLQGLSSLCTALEDGALPLLQYLSLRDNNDLDHNAAQPLLQAIQPSAAYNGLVELSLEGCPLGDNGCSTLLNGMCIAPLPPLEALTLNDTGCGDVTIDSLIRLLKQTDSRLVELLALGTLFSKAKVKELLQTLHDHKHLRSLALPKATRPEGLLPTHVRVTWS